MAKKHILFLTQMAPYPLDSGAKVRAYYMLRRLAERHEVTLFSLTRETGPSIAAQHLKAFCRDVFLHPIRRSLFNDIRSVAVSMMTSMPALILRDRSPNFCAALQEYVHENHFDAIHVDQIKTAQYIRGIAGVPRLIDMHNVYYRIIEGLARLATSPWRKWLLRREARLMAVCESRACRDFNEILAVTENDARELSRMVERQRPVTAIPICVDPRQTPVIVPTGESRDLLLLGAMFYPPNVDGVLWFVREILPRVRREQPEVCLRIVGPRPDRAILRAAAADSRILVTGRVEDLTPHLTASVALMVPLRAGSGMRVKILEAMARGIPVVSTTLGAEGIAVSRGKNILLADGADEFARAAARLLREPDLRRRLAQNARQLIETRYDWRRRYGELDAVYERLLAAGGSRR